MALARNISSRGVVLRGQMVAHSHIRAKLIAALPIIGAFFAGMLATAFILVALG